MAQLCLECGICCSGVLFKDVELQSLKESAAFARLGVGSVRGAGAPAAKVPQPCPALGADCRCAIYRERPARCRGFECALYQSVAAQRTELSAARRTIRAVLAKAERVRGMLRQLGDRDEQVALSLRFKSVRRRLEREPPNDEIAATFADLTLAVHELNLLLRAEFYPAATDR